MHLRICQNHTSPTHSFREADYVTNQFTRVSSPTGGMTLDGPSFPALLLELPDGTLLFTHRGLRES